MKTTVKEFILENMTDTNFEKLVDRLTVDYISDNHHSICDAEAEHYIIYVRENHTEANTYHVINKIGKVSDKAYLDYRSECLDRSFYDINSIVDPIRYSPQEDIVLGDPNNIEEYLPLGDSEDISSGEFDHIPSGDLDDIYLEEFDDIPLEDPIDEDSNSTMDSQEYKSFSDLQIEIDWEACDFFRYEYFIEELKSLDLNSENYKDHIDLIRNRVKLGLANFLYEILHFTTEEKMENNFKGFTNGESLVKIEYDEKSGHHIYFLIGYRDQYISDGKYVDIGQEIEGEYVDSDRLYEDTLLLYPNSGSILAPFVNYLNEEITIQKNSEEDRFEVLELLVRILVAQGFTTEKQVEHLRRANDIYPGMLEEWNIDMKDMENSMANERIRYYSERDEELGDWNFTPDIG